MFKQVRLNSDISTQYDSRSQSNQKYNFVIPSSIGWVDMKNSYFEFENFQLWDVNAVAQGGCSNLYLPWGVESCIQMTEVTNNLGTMEQIQDISVLHCNKSSYTYDYDDSVSCVKYGRGNNYITDDDGNGNYTRTGLQRYNDVFITVEEITTNPGGTIYGELTNKTGNPKAFIKNLYGVGKTDLPYPNCMIGDTVMAIQMQDPKRYNIIYNNLADLMQGANPTAVVCANVGAGTPNISTVGVNYTNENQPFCLNQTVYVFTNGAPNGGSYYTITDIQNNALAGGTITYTMNRNVTPGANRITYNYLYDVYYYTFNKVYLVLNTIEYLPEVNRKMIESYDYPFYTYSRETANRYAMPLYNHQFIIEPNVANVYLFILTHNNVYSTVDNLKYYRWLVNDKDVTNFDIDVGYGGANNKFPSPLHNDLLLRAFNNGPEQMKNLLYNIIDPSLNYTLSEAFNDTLSQFIFACPIPLSDQMQKVAIDMVGNVNFSTGIVFLFKEKMRLVKCNKGKAQLV